MRYATINPLNNQILKEFEFDSYPDLSPSVEAFRYWKKLTVDERAKQLKRVALLLEKDKMKFAELITLEMGKPLREAEYELNKTIASFEYYIQNAPAFLSPENTPTQASKSYVSFEPLGIILSVMPWNFPFWQVFRFAVPALISGNVTVLKHAPNVPQCAAAIERLFIEAEIHKGVFSNYFLTNEDTGKLITDPRIAGLSFTGSDKTGSLLACLAGESLKKCVMELGGNDAFIVLEDADLDFAIAGAIKSRSINAGQSCNGAKRFIVVKEIAAAFTRKLTEEVKKLKVGDPKQKDTDIGPLARIDLKEKVNSQVADSVRLGAQAVYGNEGPNDLGNFVAPVVLTGIREGMPAFHEELFGPVWSVITVKDAAEAISTANNSVYGLGASVWTGDQKDAEKYIPDLQAGNVFINDIVKSDPRLPFGGIKRSGFGRELAEYGLKEFVNIKTVYIH